LVRLYGTHRVVLHGFSDRMRIAEVILVGLPEGLGIDRRHLPHVVADGDELAGHIVRSHTCLYADQTRRHIRKPGDTSIARHLPAQHNPTSCVEANQVQCVLAWVNPNGDDSSVRLARHGGAPLLDCPTSMLAGGAGARPVHPILGHWRRKTQRSALPPTPSLL